MSVRPMDSLTARLDARVAQAIRVEAARTRRPIQEIVEEALRHWLRDHGVDVDA